MTRQLSCAAAHRLVEEALDDRVDERERLSLDEHLVGCPACRTFCDGASTVRDLLSSSPEVEPGALAIRRMRGQLEARLAAEVAPVGRRAPRWLWSASAAALLLVTLGGAGWLALAAPGEPALSSARGEISFSVPAPPPALSSSESPVMIVQAELATLLSEQGERRGLARGATVIEGEALSTGAAGGAVVDLGGVVRLSLGGRSEVRFERLSRAERRLQLASGWVVCEVTPEATHQGSRRLVIEAAEVSVEVAGTIFAVEINEERGVEVRVLRGRVLLRADEQGEVALSAGQRGLVAREGRHAGEVAVRALGEALAERDRALLRGEHPAPATPATPARVADIGTLFSRADEARRRGDAATAAALYQRIAAVDPSGASGGTALISLGQLRLRGNPAAARRAFQAYLSRHRGGAMRQEAYVGLMRAEVALGRQAAAREAARRYLREFRQGRYRERARRLAEDGS